MNRLIFLIVMLAMATFASAQSSSNLALKATASASESLSREMAPEKAVDGDLKSRWSGIPGHNAGVWYELDWAQPVTVGEVVVHQFDRFCFEWDVQTWDDARGQWVDAGHYGKPDVRLPLVVVCPVSPSRTTRKVRIANITNGPSFTEVEVFDAVHVHKPVVTMASDLQGNFVGMLCDAYGGSPVAGRAVTISGNSARGRWTESATSDEHGLFFAPMPIGLKGSVKVESPGVESRRFFAEGFQRTITPIGRDVKPILLTSGWRFKIDPPAGFQDPGFRGRGWSPIKVPGHWTMQGFRGDVGGYRLHFDAPKGSGRLILRFDGVYSGVDVWLNGKHVATHEGGFTPFEIDITGSVRPADNVLALEVAEHSVVSDDLDKMSQYADFPLGGIIRKVTLFRVPDVHVEALSYATRFSADGRSAEVSGHARIVNMGGKTFSQAVHAWLAGAGKGGEVFSFGGDVRLAPSEVQTVPFAFHVPEPRGWSAEHPNLCELRIGTFDGVEHTMLRVPIGLRQTEVEGTRILINKTPVKFRGTCHHDQHPLLGRAVTAALERKDVQMIKEANLNAVRTSHYPPAPELIDEADRQGLYVEDEADFCWVSVSDDLRLAPRIIQLEGELLARDRNHPSVFIWSLCNESGFGYDFERAHDFVRRVDPSRPNSAATSAWLEVATEHNPISLERLSKVANIDKPLLWDEAWCIYQGIFDDVAEMWLDPGVRDYYAEPLPKIYDAFMASKTVSGSMIWAWSDDLFCVPGTSAEYGRGTTQSHFVDAQYSLPGHGIVGDAPWGVVDGWRRRKPEFWITKKLQSPIRMAEQPYTTARSGTGSVIRLAVENQYDFRNLNELRITWASGSQTGRATADVPPRSHGAVVIRSKHAVDPADRLSLAFHEKDGRLVDEFAFPGAARAHTKAILEQQVSLHDGSMLAGDVTTIDGSHFELGFDKDQGWLRRCVAGTSPLLLDFPALHVLPTSTPLEPTPRPSEWHAEDVYVGKEGPNGRVVLTGHYDNFKGGYEWSVAGDGSITVHAKFTYTGPDLLAREVGLSFSLPRTCTQLSWKRNAEWNVYPADHIGRPEGTAKAFYHHGDAVPPTWSWSQDDSPMGSNDFRSTKRHITWARVGYPGGASVEILSDGAQSLRATVESDRIRVCVNDWYGGTNVGWNEWISNYGRGRTLKKGDVIESTLRLWLNPGK